MNGFKLGALDLRALARKQWWTLVIAIIVFCVLGYAIWRDWMLIRSFKWRFNGLNLCLHIVFHTLSLGCMFTAWHLMIKRLHGKNRLRTDFRIYTLSLLARRIPLPIWFLGSRVLLYQSEGTSAAISLTATALEQALLAFGGVVCYLVLLPWYIYAQTIPWYIPITLIVFSLLVFILRPGLLIDLLNQVQKYRHKPLIKVEITRKDLFIWGTLYMAPWFLDGIGLYFAMTSFLPLPDQVAYFIGISTVSTLVAMLTMILPAGFGLKELTMGAMLSVWIPISAGIVLSLVYRLLHTLVETFWAWIAQNNAEGLTAQGSSSIN